MKITRLSTYRVAPRWMFLKVETDEGITGWGEAFAYACTTATRAAVSPPRPAPAMAPQITASSPAPPT